jgi:hypothetical protein
MSVCLHLWLFSLYVADAFRNKSDFASAPRCRCEVRIDTYHHRACLMLINFNHIRTGTLQSSTSHIYIPPPRRLGQQSTRILRARRYRAVIASPPWPLPLRGRPGGEPRFVTNSFPGAHVTLSFLSHVVRHCVARWLAGTPRRRNVVDDGHGRIVVGWLGPKGRQSSAEGMPSACGGGERGGAREWRGVRK